MKELFYIKGDPKNPEGVKAALLEKYPNADCTYVDVFDSENHLYYVNESNHLTEAHYKSNLGEIIKTFGTEIFPQKKQEFEEKIMYQPIMRRIDREINPHCYEYEELFETLQEALDCTSDVFGYREIKVKVLKK